MQLRNLRRIRGADLRILLVNSPRFNFPSIPSRVIWTFPSCSHSYQSVVYCRWNRRVRRHRQFSLTTHSHGLSERHRAQYHRRTARHHPWLQSRARRFLPHARSGCLPSQRNARRNFCRWPIAVLPVARTKACVSKVPAPHWSQQTSVSVRSMLWAWIGRELTWSVRSRRVSRRRVFLRSTRGSCGRLSSAPAA
jgi:hypothetical protein